MNRWQRALQVTVGWGSGGEVMSKYYNVAAVAPNATPISVLKFTPGPYGRVHTMFSFPNGSDGWNYANSTAFSITNLAGVSYGNGMWWDWGGTAARKANFCIGTSPDHQACIYDGSHHGQCGAIHNSAGGWQSSNRAHELYVRE